MREFPEGDEGLLTQKRDLSSKTISGKWTTIRFNGLS